MCECGVQLLCMHSMGVLCSQTLGKVTRFLVYHFLPYSLKTGSLTETEAGLVTNKPCHPPVSDSNSTGIIDMHSYAQLCTACYTGAEDSDLGPHVCTSKRSFPLRHPPTRKDAQLPQFTQS